MATIDTTPTSVDPSHVLTSNINNHMLISIKHHISNVQHLANTNIRVQEATQTLFSPPTTNNGRNLNGEQNNVVIDHGVISPVITQHTQHLAPQNVEQQRIMQNIQAVSRDLDDDVEILTICTTKSKDSIARARLILQDTLRAEKIKYHD